MKIKNIHKFFLFFFVFNLSGCCCCCKIMDEEILIIFQSTDLLKRLIYIKLNRIIHLFSLCCMPMNSMSSVTHNLSHYAQIHCISAKKEKQKLIRIAFVLIQIHIFVFFLISERCVQTLTYVKCISWVTSILQYLWNGICQM